MIKRKKKLCKGCNTEQYLFGHMLCAYCYNNPDKRKEHGLKPLKRIQPRKRSDTPSRAINSLKSPYYGFKNQIELFEYKWNTYPKTVDGKMYCEFTGERIDLFNGKTRFINCFSHILPKGLYPLMKLNPDNIRVVPPDFHYCTENFTSDMRDRHPTWDFDKWFKLVDEMKIKYKTLGY
jgi:hypothetical protein